MSLKRVVIVGAGGFGREVLWLIRECNEAAIEKTGQPLYQIEGFVDANDKEKEAQLCDVPYLGSYDWFLTNTDAYAVCAIGSPRTRQLVVGQLTSLGVEYFSIVHPSVRMSQYVEIGEGSIICAGAILTTQIKVGKHCHINLNTTIGHDVTMGDFSTVAPGANVSGNVLIGQGCDLGTNSTIIQGLKIGRGVILGAGAVVNKDIEENTVAVGIPAKSIKKLPEFKSSS